jgi:ElaB/YqjD/DUF883 family membrane-anchored ribosome-binding protein
MDQGSSERIHDEMKETRQALTDKVAALENQVVDTLQGATCAVQETVQTVKSAMEDTVSSVKTSVADASESVKATFDVPARVRQNPWMLLLGATVSGVVAGYMLSPNKRAGQTHFARQPLVAPTLSSNRVTPGSGLFDDAFEAVRREIKNISETAVAALGSSLKRCINNGIQQFVAQAPFFRADGSEPTEKMDAPSPDRNGIACGARV